METDTERYFHAMIRHLMFAGFLLIAACAGAQTITVDVVYLDRPNRPNSDTIYYDGKYRLQWTDFWGTPDAKHFGGAVTASGFAYHADMEYDRSRIHLNIYVYTFFNKRHSWKKPHINSEYHLEHERKHFDITYIGALTFIERLRTANFTAENFKRLPSEIFEEVYAENTALQQQYDRETGHSINQPVQNIWNERIQEMLQSAEI